MIAYLTLLGTALAAFAGAPVWAALIGAAVLASASIATQRTLAPRFASLGQLRVLNVAAAQSAAYAIFVSCLAFAIGSVLAQSLASI